MRTATEREELTTEVNSRNAYLPPGLRTAFAAPRLNDYQARPGPVGGRYQPLQDANIRGDRAFVPTWRKFASKPDRSEGSGVGQSRARCADIAIRQSANQVEGCPSSGQVGGEWNLQCKVLDRMRASRYAGVLRHASRVSRTPSREEDSNVRPSVLRRRRAAFRDARLRAGQDGQIDEIFRWVTQHAPGALRSGPGREVIAVDSSNSGGEVVTNLFSVGGSSVGSDEVYTSKRSWPRARGSTPPRLTRRPREGWHCLRRRR